MEGPLRPFTDPASKASDRAFPPDDKDIDCVSDESLVHLLKSAPILHDLGQTTVVRLSKDLVLKGGGNVLPCEAKVLQMLASKSNIRAPRIHRSLHFKDETQYFGTMGYIVMDYIDGEPLDSRWRDLSDEQKMDVARQTAQMIIGMQSIKLLEPGPIGGGPCRGRFFTHYSAGPFKDVAEFEGWFNHKLDICKTYKHAPSDLPSFKFTEFVLTHQDTSPRNLILDRDGLVWLVDWADAGFYPRAFEMAALCSQSQFVDFNNMVLSLLLRYPLEEQQLLSIGYALSTAALA
ncbi:phosphotransferase family protein [Aspergillus steynii IBT 23096]|uniref:Phosphotransferase family protein n=1 Tax=Aspergillus steynii IBT 23096 TaxID=1392250 RepID=A0A2I2GML5_9EURO|nr:phosphotransferase family protein [Aspergillus steynii IBT 23096]PLB54100.1 phosphotransferase family protein [Aspergillus steynii IBT 23096]